MGTGGLWRAAREQRRLRLHPAHARVDDPRYRPSRHRHAARGPVRGGAEGSIRKCLLRADRLELSWASPRTSSTRPYPGVLAHLPATKATERREHVLFIDGSKRFAKVEPGRLRPTMSRRSSRHIGQRRIPTARAARGPARAADRDQANGSDLNIGRYIKAAAPKSLTSDSTRGAHGGPQPGLREAEERLAERLAEAGYA